MIAPYKDIEKRKIPEQKRGKESVEKIFNATKELLNTIGPDRLSTNKIAEKAEMSTGAIYNFFPNKESILYAIADSWLEDLRARYLEACPSRHNYVTPYEWIDRVALDNIALYEKEPLVAKYYNALTVIPDLRKLDTDHDNEVAEILSECQFHFNPNMEKQQAHANAMTMVQIIHGVLTNAAGQPEEVADIMRANLRYMLASFAGKFLT